MIVELIVINPIKTKKPIESWAYLLLLAETEGFEPSIQVYARMLP